MCSRQRENTGVTQRQVRGVQPHVQVHSRLGNVESADGGCRGGRGETRCQERGSGLSNLRSGTIFQSLLLLLFLCTDGLKLYRWVNCVSISRFISCSELPAPCGAIPGSVSRTKSRTLHSSTTQVGQTFSRLVLQQILMGRMFVQIKYRYIPGVVYPPSQ